MAPITECLKNKEFQWSNAASQAFREIKVRMTEAPVLRYPDFTKDFEVACDASGVGIGGVGLLITILLIVQRVKVLFKLLMATHPAHLLILFLYPLTCVYLNLQKTLQNTSMT